ncbi:hypothetical protein IW492_00825 [Enterococcus sp. BWB1-3]|uniref:hypothetical protein n=1 Tax=unclassified Enterococcus TaxID=2608891 RepID=UPI00192059DA|nr:MULTISPECIES: hypothetical protein [unclassified Enterococcus]MBL1227773.1 hypothetical protein [Enterococcus sp. BWB1-3]MCB5954552.1 hypothetical protein [Enterococcus sp. CWB-B31]
MKFYGLIRFLVLFILAAYTFLIRKKIRKRRKGRLSDSLKNYSKDIDGLYPWEKNTDNSPKSIPANAKRFKEKEKIKRGRW